MANIQQIFTLVIHLILLALTCLSIAAASSKARTHLAWLVPMALAWFFSVSSSLFQLVFFAVLQNGGFSNNSYRWLQLPLAVLSPCNSLAWLWAGVVLLIRMQAMAPEGVSAWKRPQDQSEKGSWPPPPTV